MAYTTYTTQFTTQIGTTDEKINVLIEYGTDFNNDGFDDIKITLSIDSTSNSGTEDIIGVAFDINDTFANQSSILSGLQIQNIQRSTSNSSLSTFSPTYVIKADSISDNNTAGYVDPGFLVRDSDPQRETEPYDIGIKFSDQGSGEGIVQTASFIISKPNTNLDETLIENTDWFIRLQSTDNGTGSAQTGGRINDLPPATGGSPGIDVEKFVSVDGGTTWLDADTVTGPSLLIGNNPLFKFVVKNIGAVNLTNITLSDNVFDLNGSDSGTAITIPSLAVGASTEYIFNDATWQSDQHVNAATASATYNGTTVTDIDEANYFGANPSIDVEKYVSVDGGTTFVDADSITGPYLLTGNQPIFKFVVTNTGNVALSNITLSDSDFDINGAAAGTSITIASLTAGGTYETTFTAPWQTGQHTNTATVSTTYNDNGGHNQPLSDSDDANYFGATPSIDVEKYVSVDGGTTFVDADTATGPLLFNGTNPIFKFVVTNTGNVALSNITLSDSDFDINGAAAGTSITIASLAAGGTYETTFTAPWQAGQHTNTATVSTTYNDNGGHNQPLSDTDDANYFGADPNFTIDKQVTSVLNPDNTPDSDGKVDQVGDKINYQIVVKNTGNIALTGVNITDSLIPNLSGPSGDTNNNNQLDVTETWTYTGSYTVTQANLDNNGGGSLAGFNAALPNQVTFKIQNPGTTAAAPTPSYFDITINNGGTLNGIYDGWCIDTDHSISQNTFYTANVYSSYETLPVGLLEKPQNLDLVNWIINQNYVGTQAFDLLGPDAGNNGLGESLGTYTYGDIQRAIWALIDDQNSTGGLGTWSQDRADEIVAAAQANGEGFTPDCDDKIAVILAPTNNNTQITITQVTLADVEVPCDDGCIVNVATVDTDQTTQKSDSECVEVDQNPALDVEKYVSVDGGTTFVDADSITGPFLLSGTQPIFKFVVTNTGNVALSNITLSDSDFDINGAVAGTSITIASLAAGGTYQTTFTAPWQAGQHTNTATASTTFNTQPLSDTDDANYFGANPSIDVEKYVSVDGGTTFVDADSITGPYLLTGNQPIFKFVVTNTGNVALSNVTLSDSDFDINGAAAGTSITIASLAAGGTYETTFTAPWQTGQHTNTATVSTTYTDNGGHTQPLSDADDANYFGANPSIDVEKYVSVDGGTTFVDADSITGPFLLSGTQPIFKFVVTNTGNVALSNVTLDDSKFDLNGAAAGTAITIGSLAAGGTYETTFTGTWQAGQHTNTATTSGSYSDDGGNSTTKTDSDDANYFGANPGINIDKVTDNGSVQGDSLLIQQGSAIKWIYTVTNTGNVGLSNVMVTDNQGVTPVGVDANTDGFIDGDSNENNVLDLTETWIYEATGTATSGSYTNTGTAKGSFTDSGNHTQQVTDTDDSSYTGVVSPGARTPGFWKNWAEVWDGNASNDSKFVGRDGFPMSDILLAPYSSFKDTDNDGKVDTALDPVTGTQELGILVGDWNKNGVTDNGEKTLFYSLTEAMTIISADQKVQQDKRYTLDRSLIASWLNYLAVNPAPQGDMNQAIQWMQQYTPNENGITGGDGNLVKDASNWAVSANSAAWSNSGELLNAKLDYYNNTGSFGVQPV